MNRYKVYLRHDNGVVSFYVMADSIAQAVERVLAAEGAPERAIYRIDANPKEPT